MDSLWTVVQDWRFAGAVALLGAIIGHIIYRKIPAPDGVAEDLEKMIKAGLAGAAAKERGAQPLQMMAEVVGARAAKDVDKALSRQRRKCLVGGLVLAALVLAFVFHTWPLQQVVPGWVFAVVGLLGLYRVWKLW